MNISDKKICSDYAVIYDYVHGGFIFDSNHLVLLIDDIPNKIIANQMLKKIEDTSEHLDIYLKKMKFSKELRFLFSSGLHDAIITDVSITSDGLIMKIDLSDVKTMLFDGIQVLTEIKVEFDKGSSYDFIKENVLNRTITRLDISIIEEMYEIYLETYDFSPNAPNNFDCIKIKFMCDDIHFLIRNNL